MILANLWENTLQPIYKVIAMTGTMLVIWFGGQNVLGTGWETWDIAAFSTYLVCFIKLATKSSHAAKLFNAIQKAQVSWQRIQPHLQAATELPDPVPPAAPAALTVRHLSFTYPGSDGPIFQDLSFSARPGTIIGITARPFSVKTRTAARFSLAPRNWATATRRQTASSATAATTRNSLRLPSKRTSASACPATSPQS